MENFIFCAVNQGGVLSDNTLVIKTKFKIVRKNESKNIKKKLTKQTRRAITEVAEKGSSTGPSVLLLEQFGFLMNWIAFVEWLSYEKRLASFPVGGIVRDPHDLEFPTPPEQDLNLLRTWLLA